MSVAKATALNQTLAANQEEARQSASRGSTAQLFSTREIQCVLHTFLNVKCRYFTACSRLAERWPNVTHLSCHTITATL